MKRKLEICACLMILAITNCFSKTYNLHEAITAATETICKKIDGKVDVVAVIDILSDSKTLSDFVNNELFHEFVITLNQTIVVERDAKTIELIEKELDYQYSGNVSDETIHSLGYSLGADCVVLGSVHSDVSGWKFELRTIDVETKKVIVSWKSIIKKNDRDILFQIKNADKNKQKKTILIEPTIEKELPEFNLRKIATMYNTNLSYSDIAEIFIQRFGIDYVNDASYVVSTSFSYETPEDLIKRKGEYAWTVYSSSDNKYTLLVLNTGCILLSRFYEDGEMYGTESKYFCYTFPEFVFNTAINMKAAGKAYSYDEIKALDKILLGFENSTYYNKYEEDFRPNIVSVATWNFRTEGHGVSSEIFIEMCVKSGFDKDEDGNPIFHKAFDLDKCEGGIELVQMLINLNVDINQRGAYGETPLMSAIYSLDISDVGDRNIRILLNAGANVNLTNDYGETALMIAEKENCYSVINLLKKFGAQ